MFRYLRGEVTEKDNNFVVVDVNGVGYKILTSISSQGDAILGEESTFYTYLHVREDILDLFGFTSVFELEVFEKLISVSGVGPRSGLSILNVAGVNELVAAINSGKSELLTRVSGVGRKTAERVVLDLKGKIESKGDSETLGKMESDIEIEEALVSMGYTKRQVLEALKNIDKDIEKFEDRLKAVLQEVSGNNKNG